MTSGYQVQQGVHPSEKSDIFECASENLDVGIPLGLCEHWKKVRLKVQNACSEFSSGHAIPRQIYRDAAVVEGATDPGGKNEILFTEVLQKIFQDLQRQAGFKHSKCGRRP